MAEITPAILRKWSIFSKWTDEELDKIVFVNFFQPKTSGSNLGALVLTTDDEAFHLGCTHVLLGGEGEKMTKVDSLSGLGLMKVEVGGTFCAALTNDDKLYFWGNPYPEKPPKSAYIYYEKFARASCSSCRRFGGRSLYYQKFVLAGVEFKSSCPECGEGGFSTYTVRPSNGKDVIKLVKFEEAVICCTKCRRTCTAYKIGDFEVNYCAICDHLPQHGDTVGKVTPTPRLIELGETNKVVDIASGREFFVALTNQNCLILWGRIDMREYQGTLYNPSNAIFKAVFCGGSHIAALSVQGDLYTCGHGDKGQLGYGWTPEMGYETLRKVPMEGKVQKVCCGYSTTVCLRDDGALMAFGANMKMLSPDILLLNRKQCDYISEPARIMLSLRVVDVANSPLTNVFCAKTETLMFIWGRETDRSPQPELVLGERALMSSLADLPASFNFKTPCTEQTTITDRQESELYGKKFLSDLTLKLADGNFPVHRLILRARSVYFHNAFEDNDADDALDMSHYNAEAYKCLLKYFYQLPPTELSITDLFDLYMLATSYKEAAIAQEAFAKLKTSLNPGTVLPLLGKAKEANCSEFLEVCRSFIDSPGFKHILAEKVSKDMDKTLTVLELLSTKND